MRALTPRFLLGLALLTTFPLLLTAQAPPFPEHNWETLPGTPSIGACPN